MTGQQLIDAIIKHGCENLQIFYSATDRDLNIETIIFDNGVETLPRPKINDVNVDEIAYTYHYKIIQLDRNTGASECFDRVICTSKKY